MNTRALDAVFVAAVAHAIKTVGIAAFKRSSFFGSNEASAQEMKKAA
jgi:hypothetical protein